MNSWLDDTLGRLVVAKLRLSEALRQLRAGQPSPPEVTASQPSEPLVDEVGELMEAFTEARTEVVETLSRATELSETHVVAVGECIGEIVSETQEFVQTVQHTLGQHRAGAQVGGVNGALTGQSQAIERYLRDLLADSQAQQATTARAIELCTHISKAAARVNRMAGASKLLSLNTSIHANRLGGDGRALGVIAHEMQETSDRVRHINERIGGTARELIQAISNTVSQTEQLRMLAADFKEEINNLGEEIKAGSQAVEARVLEAAELSEGRVGELLSQSMEALSLLQFQDPMIQSLQQLDPLLAETQTTLAKALGVDQTYTAARFMTNLGLHLDTAKPVEVNDLDSMMFFD